MHILKIKHTKTVTKPHKNRVEVHNLTNGDVIKNKAAEILVLLLSRPNEEINRIEIIEIVWGGDLIVDNYHINALKVHICHLRKFLKNCDGYELVTRPMKIGGSFNKLLIEELEMVS